MPQGAASFFGRQPSRPIFQDPQTMSLESRVVTANLEKNGENTEKAPESIYPSSDLQTWCPFRRTCRLIPGVQEAPPFFTCAPCDIVCNKSNTTTQFQPNVRPFTFVQGFSITTTMRSGRTTSETPGTESVTNTGELGFSRKTTTPGESK